MNISVWLPLQSLLLSIGCAVASVGILYILPGLISEALASHVLDALSGGLWKAEGSMANLTCLCHQTSCFAVKPSRGQQRTAKQNVGLGIWFGTEAAEDAPRLSCLWSSSASIPVRIMGLESKFKIKCRGHRHRTYIPPISFFYVPCCVRHVVNELIGLHLV